ncbi:MAG: hypothetical protein EU544_05020 [Promethearchaeota archaeon]|nr:MAG: hypothetical protein EU544_05020 [Candidatus Lokiarchaeota archaeon]
MVFPPSAVVELKFVVTLGVILVGWEIGAYFIYQYFRTREQHVEYNRVLLGYGFLLILGYFCLLIITFDDLFITDPEFSAVFLKIGYAAVLSSPLILWGFTYVPQFKNILHPNLHRFLILKSFIPILTTILFPISTPLFNAGMALIFIDTIFLLVLQIKFIQLSVAEIKKRFLMITLGEILLMVSMLFGAELFMTVLNVGEDLAFNLYFVGLFIMFIGELVTFFAVLDFPPILELKWQDSLVKLVIINQRSNNCIFSYDFIEVPDSYETETHLKLEKGDKNKLFSGGILGIDSIIAAITDTKEEKIKKIKQGEAFIFLEYGSDIIPLTYALVIKEEFESARYFLRALKRQFESFYREILSNLDQIKGNEDIFFSSFDIIVNNMV